MDAIYNPPHHYTPCYAYSSRNVAVGDTILVDDRWLPVVEVGAEAGIVRVGEGVTQRVGWTRVRGANGRCGCLD